MIERQLLERQLRAAELPNVGERDGVVDRARARARSFKYGTSTTRSMLAIFCLTARTVAMQSSVLPA